MLADVLRQPPGPNPNRCEHLGVLRHYKAQPYVSIWSIVIIPTSLQGPTIAGSEALDLGPRDYDNRPNRHNG